MTVTVFHYLISINRFLGVYFSVLSLVVASIEKICKDIFKHFRQKAKRWPQQMKRWLWSKYPCYIILFHCVSHFSSTPLRLVWWNTVFLLDMLLGHTITKAAMTRFHKVINKEKSTVPDLNEYRPVTAIAAPMKTHSPADHSFLESRVGAI